MWELESLLLLLFPTGSSNHLGSCIIVTKSQEELLPCSLYLWGPALVLYYDPAKREQSTWNLSLSQLILDHASASKVCVLVAQSCPTLLTHGLVARQAPLSMGFSRQQYWSELPFPSPSKVYMGFLIGICILGWKCCWYVHPWVWELAKKWLFAEELGRWRMEIGHVGWVFTWLCDPFWNRAKVRRGKGGWAGDQSFLYCTQYEDRTYIIFLLA